MAMVRGVPVEKRETWIRAHTPFVEYTGGPLAASPAPTLTKSMERRKRAADVRLRRALSDAWCEPSRARRDLLAAGVAFADLGDAQGVRSSDVNAAILASDRQHTLWLCAGLANAFVAHAQTRVADAYMAQWGQQLSIPASNMAREEFAHAHQLYTSLLEVEPTHYSARRQRSVHKASIGQRMRPVPLRFTADDTRVAIMDTGL
jgi:hypothetical protein